MRISRQHMFMQMAEVAAMRSTCFRGNTGALVIFDNDVVSMGYNGPPSGDVHCKGNACELHNGGCARSVHAEVNAIDKAMGKWVGGKLFGCDLYSLSGPCPGCTERIIYSQVSRVFYRHPYRILDGIRSLIDHKVAVYRVMPAGTIIEEATNRIIDPESMARVATHG